MDIVSVATEKGVTERRFDLKVGNEVVPGIWWAPEGATGARPTVLLGHGGTQHKRVVNVLGLARRFVRHRGWNAVAIDAPGHGERASEEAAEAARKRLQARIAEGRSAGRPAPWTPELLEEMATRTKQAVPEWKATLDDLLAHPDFGAGPYGYWGVSMGTVIGLPLVASEPRITCAVLGLSGLRPDRPGNEAFEAAAKSLTIPVLVAIQSEDELVARDAGVAMWDAIPAPDKALHIHPGPHVGIPLYERDIYELFFARHLTPES